MTARFAHAACEPYVAEQPRWASASFRPHRDGLQQCPVSEEVYGAVIGAWLSARAGEAPAVASLSLGRAVDFPWLSQAIADAALASPDWAERARRARPGHRAALAAPILRSTALRERLALPFSGSAYEVRDVAYEKVLFGKASEHATHVPAGQGDVLVPFDAMLWLRLVPRGSRAGAANTDVHGAPSLAPRDVQR
ncbi:hypothetical protein K2Z84_13640 [Candidatus Binatia bacterium]|nr:hypothetical protein [Candidatus Binatia bacterium]